MNIEEQRFVTAFAALREGNRLTLADFCRDNAIDKPRLVNTIKGDTNRHVPVSWFGALCRYGVSAEWLLTGAGEMMIS